MKAIACRKRTVKLCLNCGLPSRTDLEPISKIFSHALDRPLYRLTDELDSLTVTGGAAVAPDAAFEFLADWVRQCAKDKARLYFVGNGASANMANQFSTYIVKISGAPAEVFTDPDLITSIGNYDGY